MRENKFQMFELTEILPAGWLKEQLKIQANGLSGVLYDVWDSVGSYNAWLGGTGDNWERAPYFVDGILPLAFYLKDEKLEKIAKNYVEWMLDSQDEEGNFGPEETKKDWWSRMVAMKVLVQYYEITKEERVLEFMHKYYHFQYEALKDNPLSAWGKIRCADLVYCIKWLYERQPQEYLLELAELLVEQSDDWNSLLRKFPFVLPAEYYYDWKTIERYAKEEIERLMKFHHSHIVNVTMGLKYPALTSWLSGEDKEDILKAGLDTLKKYHGVATGAINGDEHLAGNNPNRGTELCAIAEYMFSLQIILEIFGGAEYADLLERLAYNSFPAMFSEDYMGHQYLQQVNQIKATNEERGWYNNLSDSNTYGLEPNFGCCTANMHQGWPKLLKSLWYKEDNGIASIVFAPNELRTVWNGEEVRIEEKTEYPARLEVRYHMHKVPQASFVFRIRIPGWCQAYSLTVDGKEIEHKREEGYVKLCRKFEEGQVVAIRFEAQVQMSEWYNGSVAVERGPLLFALDMNENWSVYKRRPVVSDYEVTSDSAWNYALLKDQMPKVIEETLSDIPFRKQTPPITLVLKARKVKEWQEEGGNAGEMPKSPVKTDSPEEEIRLIPFGCTHLRVGQFPVCVK